MTQDVDKPADSEKTGDAGAPEIVVTEEMVGAGIEAIEPGSLRDAEEGWYDKSELVTRIFLAMMETGAKPKRGVV